MVDEIISVINYPCLFRGLFCVAMQEFGEKYISIGI